MGTQHEFIGVNESGSRIAGVEVIACETDVSDVALGASVPEGGLDASTEPPSSTAFVRRSTGVSSEAVGPTLSR